MEKKPSVKTVMFCFGEIERFLKLEKVRYLNYNAFWVENATVGLGSSYETSRVSYHVIMAFIYHVFIMCVLQGSIALIVATTIN